jgi:hypothetical protein
MAVTDVSSRYVFSWYPFYFDFHSALVCSRGPAKFLITGHKHSFIEFRPLPGRRRRNEVHFWHYKKYGSVGRFTVFGTYFFKSKLYHFLQMSAFVLFMGTDESPLLYN